VRALHARALQRAELDRGGRQAAAAERVDERVEHQPLERGQRRMRGSRAAERAAAPHLARPLAPERAGRVEVDHEGLAVGADAGVQVDQHALAHGGQAPAQLAPQGHVRPLGLASAVEDAVRVQVLPAVERGGERLLAHARTERVHGRERARDLVLVPVGQHQVRVQLGVVLGAALPVRHAPRVDRVHQHHAHAGRQRAGAVLVQPGAHYRGAGVALDAMRPADGHEHAGGVGVAEEGDVLPQGLAVRACQAMARSPWMRPPRRATASSQVWRACR
jgi:hypothetical protein